MQMRQHTDFRTYRRTAKFLAASGPGMTVLL